VKVAQYPAAAGLGWRSEKATRPGWDDRRALTVGNPDAIDQTQNISIVPGWTDIFFCLIFQSGSCRMLGYFH
jgi:hypothetical protein